MTTLDGRRESVIAALLARFNSRTWRRVSRRRRTEPKTFDQIRRKFPFVLCLDRRLRGEHAREHVERLAGVPQGKRN